MCLIVLGKNINKDYPLILLANRDEFFNRPTLVLHHWEEGGITGGKDLSANGTWLGVNKSGKLAAITNYRDFKNLKKEAPSRGLLTLNFLKCEESPEEYIKQISSGAHMYNGFNLILGKGNHLVHYSNITGKITVMENGIYGLSNALLDTPWPKVEKSKKLFHSALTAKNIVDEQLIGLLSDRTTAEDDQLPDTGIELELEKKLSSMFIHFPGYGTRCTSLIKKDRDGNISFTEVSYDEKGRRVRKENIKVGIH